MTPTKQGRGFRGGGFSTLRPGGGDRKNGARVTPVNEVGEAGNGLSAGARRRVELARMEADVVYFQARMDFLDEPATSNQAAQRKAFKHLYSGLSSQVAAAKEAQTNDFSVDGLFDG